jgi:ribosome-associated translation inhibitor RaiA
MTETEIHPKSSGAKPDNVVRTLSIYKDETTIKFHGNSHIVVENDDKDLYACIELNVAQLKEIRRFLNSIISGKADSIGVQGGDQ